MNEIILQTTKDYDLDVAIVEEIYNSCGGTLELYEKLEDHLKIYRS